MERESLQQTGRKIQSEMYLRHREGRKFGSTREKNRKEMENYRPRLVISVRINCTRNFFKAPDAYDFARILISDSRGPWFSFFRLHLVQSRRILRCNEELHIFKHNFGIRARTRLRAHKERHVKTHDTRKGGHLHRVYVYTYHGTYEIKYIQ